MSGLQAYFSIAQAAAKHMPKGSAIINVASVQAYQPEPGILDYATTKVLTMLLLLPLPSGCMHP